MKAHLVSAGKFLASLPGTLKLASAAIIIIAGLYLNLTGQVRRANVRGDSLELVAQNERALRDTSRRVDDPRITRALELLEGFGDSIVATQRLVRQVKQSNDAIDRALSAERVALTTIRMRLDTLALRQKSAGATRQDSTGVRSAKFEIQREPYRGTIDVMLPPPPAQGLIDLNLKIDDARFQIRTSCREPRPGERLRQPIQTLIGPTWLPYTIDETQQDPEICNGKALAETKRSKLVVGLSAGVGIAAHQEGYDMPVGFVGVTLTRPIRFCLPLLCRK